MAHGHRGSVGAEDTPSGGDAPRLRISACVCTEAFLPAGEPGLGLLPVLLQPHPPARGSPPSPLTSPLSPLFLTSLTPRSPASPGRDTSTLSPGPTAARKALEDRGRCIRHQMSAGLASKSSSWKVEGTSGHGKVQPRTLVLRPRQASEGLQEALPRPGQLSSTGVPGRAAALRVYKPVPRSHRDLPWAASANQTPQRDPHTSFAPLSLIHTPREARGRNRSREPQRKGRSWVVPKLDRRQCSRFTRLLLKTKTIERTECTEKTAWGRQPGKAGSIPATGRAGPASRTSPRPHPPYRPRLGCGAVRERAPGCLDPQAVSTHGQEQAGGTQFSSRTASPEPQARPAALVKPFTASVTHSGLLHSGSWYKHLEGGEPKLLQGCSWWEVVHSIYKMSPQMAEQKKQTPKAEAPAGSPRHLALGPGQSEAWTLELLQDDLRFSQ